MRYYKKIVNILDNEGVNSFARRLISGLKPQSNQEKVEGDPKMNQAKIDYEKDFQKFHSYISDSDVPGINNFYWYHTVDLGNGIATPGDYDFRSDLAAFRFPENMSGMKVLDVGAATGFFSFEFERRGAEVTAIELPSLLDWDIIHGEQEEAIDLLKAYHKSSSIEETYYRHLKGPFDYCHSQLRSSVKRVFSSVYDLTPELLGNQQFDIVFAGDILLHLFSPLQALNVIAPLCKNKLIITSDVFPDASSIPLMRFLGTENKKRSKRFWWNFNQQCIEEMMLRVGFTDVSVVGEYSGVIRRVNLDYQRLIFHGTK